MKAEVIVHSRKTGKKYEFFFTLHQSQSGDMLQIEASFYEEWSTIPVGIHYEIEIISPDLKMSPVAKQIHYHTSKTTEKDFICWTGQISSKEELAAIVNMWTAGTVYTIETGEDFAKLYDAHRINEHDHAMLVHILKGEKYGIEIPRSSYRFK